MRWEDLVLLFLDRLRLGARAGGGLVLQTNVLRVFVCRAVLGHLEDGLCLDDLELGLEVLSELRVRRGVAATTRVVHGVVGVLDLISRVAPVSLTTAILLCLLGIGIDETGLGKVFRDLLMGLCLAGVVTITELVGASHGVEVILIEEEDPLRDDEG